MRSHHSSRSSTKYPRRTNASSNPLTLPPKRLQRSNLQRSVGASRVTVSRNFSPLPLCNEPSLLRIMADTNSRSHAFVSQKRDIRPQSAFKLWSFLGIRHRITPSLITQVPGLLDLKRLSLRRDTLCFLKCGVFRLNFDFFIRNRDHYTTNLLAFQPLT